MQPKAELVFSMTQKTIYLHIGRHKTGTSSIQHFISNHPEVLNELKLHYPETGRKGIAHHKLADLFSYQSNKTPEARLATEQSATTKALLNEIESQPNDVLISSEGFQNSDPYLIKKALQGYKLRVLVYIRNQIDYLASSYAQRVWATRYSGSMDDYYNRVFSVDYLHFLNNWDDASGGEIHARKFSRDTLCENDIVTDFFVEMLGANTQSLKQQIQNREIADANPSLTSDLLAYKLKFNASDIECTDLDERLIRQALASLSLKKQSSPVRVTEALKSNCRQKCADINKNVSEKYFDGKELFDMDRPAGTKSELTKVMLANISDQLIAAEPRIKETILRFNESEYPTLKAG